MKKLVVNFVLIGLATALIYYAFNYFFPSNRTSIILPQRGSAVQAVYATGTVEPSVMIPISPRISSRLMALNADEGQIVKKGDVLGQMEDTDKAGALAELTARAERAQKNYERQSQLFKRKAISPETLEQARADMDATAAAVKRAEAEQSFLKLIAPEDGTIIRRDGEIGQTIPQGQAVFWMSCCAPLRITTEVDEEDISLVKPGQKVLITADAFPGKNFEGTVTSITPKGDPVARSYRVRVSLPAGTPLMIGMTAETNIIVHENENALLVPASAIQNNTVWTIDAEGKARKINVTVGARSAQTAEIKEGITDQSRIIREPSATIKEGDALRVYEESWQALP